MLQAVDKLHYHYPRANSVLQGSPPAPAAMDFTYDGLYHSFTPNGYVPFPSGLTQTLCELDIDHSIHKLFEGLPEILDDSAHRDEASAVCRPLVTSSTSPFFPSTPPAQGTRPSSMSYNGSVLQAIPVPQKGPVFLRPKPQELAPAATVAVADRKGVPRGRKGKGSRIGEVKVVSRVQSMEKSKGLEIIATSASQVVPGSIQALPIAAPSGGVCVVPMSMPATRGMVDLGAEKGGQHGVNPGIGLVPQVCLRPPKRSRRDAVQAANSRTQKTRFFDKVEHIVRERWRRDDMAGKFLALESLLPPSSKRDRSTIVEDSMKLVKSLQHRKEEALRRRSELKSAPSPGVKITRIIQKIGLLSVIPHSVRALESGSTPSSSSMALSSGQRAGTKRPLEAVELLPSGSDSAALHVPKLLRDCVERFYIQSELNTEDIVIEMICEQIPNFHSLLLKSMESLGLEVVRCSVTKTVNKLICNISVKPFASSASAKLSSKSIMEGLSTAFRTS